ncbi:NAC domain-containing protein 78 [Morella rubra]|uniref:NAC domain-containing protein 78 n=1 Tax=Morella rubra TaxID=262757 RepID=A0A6A1WAT1_9ROSI|nr:NAC domain-containing protein 78 [Morella rubra]
MKVKSELRLSADDAWPPGFRFHPTDEELILYYLKRKICGRRLKLNIIADIDVYKSDPEELPAQSELRTRDRQWFFFSPRDRKYPNGGRSNRATAHGYWKATGKDRNITCNSRGVGVKKTLVFYRGRAPNGTRTDWVMHEYTMDEEELKRCQNVKDYYALYKLYKKSGPGPKNGEQYGAPFKEEEWADDECPDFNNSAERDISAKLHDEVVTVNDSRINGHIQSTLDEFDEFLRRIADEIVHDQPQIDDIAHFQSQVGEEETQSTMVDPSSREVVNPEPIRGLHPSGLQCDVQTSFDFTQSTTSQMQLHEPPAVTSAPNLQINEPLIIHEEDFLEIDDLIGPEPSVSNNDNSLETLQFEEAEFSLSEFDLFHDADLFLHDMGPINQEAVADPYMNALEYNSANQFDHQLQPTLDIAGQIVTQTWADDERRSIHTPAELNLGSFSPQPSGIVFESTNIPTQANENQNGNEGGGATNRFSSALWAFVESIPTTPASASENALVNRAFERMSSFSRARVNVRNTNVSAPIGAGTRTVGNIPYDATEEQLIEICQEVGPVVSFRLVIDRETGKPKGYGFCEYKDEETALSARRNLQGYEINGRQLRVDFAENDKGGDRNREQGRGGPGLAANVDPQKQVTGSVNHGESVHHQPIGLHIAITAAAVMAGALGGAQAGIQSNQNGLHSQSALANDPLTLHLAKMSRSQLNEIMSELKLMATQNKELSRQLLVARPQLPKALSSGTDNARNGDPPNGWFYYFQFLQMPNIRQTSGQPTQPPLHSSQRGQPPAVQTLPGLPPPSQNKMQSGLISKLQENQVAGLPQNSLVHNQFSALPQTRIQLPQHSNMPIVQPTMVPTQSAASALGSLSSRLQGQVANSSSLNQQMQPTLLQHSGQVGAASLGHGLQMVNPNATTQASILPSPPMLDASLQSQLPPEVESVLLQQVLSLTPEQLSSLPPEQQQQVIQLQQALRRDQIQPS